ncbi:MAG: LysR family transcriptional regulator [Aquabacterium sp.]
MDIRQLRYFVAVAEAGHITRAAAVLGMQQPPLTQQMRRLEAELGLPLLERHPRGVRLTDAGQALLADARPLLASFDGLRQRLRQRADGDRGRLAVAFTSSAAAHAFTPQALRECRLHHPGIELHIDEDNAAAITEAVAAGRLNAGLIRVPVAHPPGVRFQTLLHEPALLALPVDHPLAARPADRSVPLRALHEEPMILVRRPGAPGLYANLLERCARLGVQPRIVAEVDRMMTNLNLVAAGAGLSVVPASMAGHHAQAVVYRRLPTSARLDAPLTLLTRLSDPSPLTRRLVERLLDLAQRWPA